MIDLKDRTYTPSLDEIAACIRNPLFGKFCRQIKEKYNCRETIDFSACSMEPGWNIKFRKSGKALCTIYPRESYFTVMVVVGRKEKEAVEALLPQCTDRLGEIYGKTKEGNGLRWLMIDLEDPDALYQDVLRLIEIRARK